MFGWFLDKPKFKVNDIIYEWKTEKWEIPELLQIKEVGKYKYYLLNLRDGYKDTKSFLSIDDYYSIYNGSLEGIDWDKVNK